MILRGDDLLALGKDALQAAGEADAEICLRSRARGVARFAISELGQHMDLVEPTAFVRVARGLRIGEVATSALTREGLVTALREAAEVAAVAPETDGFAGFAPADEGAASPARAPRVAASTRTADAERRVALLAPALEKIAARGLISAGVLETETVGLAVVTTHGCARSHDETSAHYRVWALETAGAGGAAGFGMFLHRDIDALRIEEETERAIRMAELGKSPGAVDVGRYDVVLEPAAVAELVETLGGITFPAPEIERGSSALAGRIGERITGEHVTIVEDPLDPTDLGFGAPFDREGTWRSRIPLVERGIAKSGLYDRTTAKRHGVASTGSAVVADLFGTIGATSLHLEGGDAPSVDALLSGVKRGLYVCRLHYVNGYLEPRRAVMTGLSRDGCFLVEDGRITKPVGNVRFTDSFLEALTRCDEKTSARAAVRTWVSEMGATVVPALRIRDFEVTGRSQEPVSL